MRHSTIDLTMNTYTDPKLLDVAGALEALPSLPLDIAQAGRQEQRATGTDDLVAPMVAPTSDFSCAPESFAVKMGDFNLVGPTRPGTDSVFRVRNGTRPRCSAPVCSTRYLTRPSSRRLSKSIWGCRASGPYLHDGRAETFEEAIAMHGGEAEKTSVRFFGLSATQRQQMLAFLKSLTAPRPQFRLRTDRAIGQSLSEP